MRTTSEAGATAAQSIFASIWEYSFAPYPLCPGVTGAPDTPATVAHEYWSVHLKDALARPRPAIAPRYMITGKVAYLEANTKMAERFDHPTALGVLVIEAVGQLFADWGDGTGVPGPYSNPGRPWPDGTITHTWTHQGRYDVVVTERWTATWRLGGLSGTLRGLATEGRIEDFEVRQLQAVRNR